VLIEGEYGMKDLFVGVPVLIGGKGVEKIIEMKLDAGEHAALQASGKQVAEGIAELANVGV
jgi:malate dehydrogenase